MSRSFTGIVFSIVIGLILSGKGYSQSIQIDSLKHVLRYATNKERINIYIDLAWEYSSNDYYVTLQYADSAYASAVVVGDSLGIVKSLRFKGKALRRLNKIDSSINVEELALNIASRNRFTSEYVKVLNGLSINYIYKANYDKALDFSFKSLQLREEDGDLEKVSICLNNIGLIYYKLVNLNKSLEYYLRSLKIKREINCRYDLVVLLCNISLVYTYLGNYKEGLSYATQAFKECDDLCDDYSKLQMFFARGMVLFQSDTDAEDAIRYFTESYNIAKRCKSDRFILDNADKLAALLMKKKQYRLAEDYLKEAELVEGETYNRERIVLYNRFFELYSIERNWPEKFLYQKKYIELKDSVFNEQLIENLSTIQSDYLERDRNAKIVSQTRMLDLKNEMIARQKWLNILMGAIPLLLLVLVYVLYRRNQQSKNINLLLNERITERMKELNASCEIVQQKLCERDLIRKQGISEFNNSIRVAREVCSLAKEGDDHVYFRQIDLYMSALSEMLCRK